MAISGAMNYVTGALNGISIHRDIMSDPYNSYPSKLPAGATNRAIPAQPSQDDSSVRSQVDRISGLDVSDKWKERFRLIERAGGPGLQDIRDLNFSERYRLASNLLALFFWPIYLPVKGLWRPALAYFFIGTTCALVLGLIDAHGLDRSVGYSTAFLASWRTNVNYYRRVVLGEASWF
jgi:hypothetical protein